MTEWQGVNMTNNERDIESRAIMQRTYGHQEGCMCDFCNPGYHSLECRCEGFCPFGDTSGTYLCQKPTRS